MAQIQLNLPHHQYTIRIEPGLLASLGEQVRAVAPHERAALLADGNVFYEPFGENATASLQKADYNVVTNTIDPGEEHKTLDTVRILYDLLVEARLERKSPIIALGGGVTGDMVGFVAASYLRGVPFVQCPTTLLAMVDASVGGKVGVNLPQGKNLVGAFYQPRLVVIDTDTLGTLPARELQCGLAECVKHAMIRDPQLFDWLEEQLDAILALDAPTLVELVRRNVAIKADVVMTDEKEAGVRAHLNFGHTFGHAIESQSGYGHYHHGEGVSLGMAAATRLAVDREMVGADVLDRLIGLLNRIGLPTRAADLPPTERLIEAMQLDKKVSDSRIRLILPEALGRVTILDDINHDAIAAAWDSLRST
jgi:3-dehydroquinate synthase